ncbi:carboxyvinyl-carboxyphosphonate phosphorylmutase [Desulfuromusa kysingii]|uniref:Methylisocitrate lyase n=1 Tax=Desulfuromusa kysingii TaxID=37625 RepID=A0A1H4E5T7_9BACT|nr:methylisocitrate lyase [Desulfuromusa kysingii]SEA80197.1 carboxyvinyl-carboxyphosphonate phosphorylmutase [Desulfuromusa kysingii]
MNWLEGNNAIEVLPGERLDQLLQRDGILKIPGAHNALAGLLAREAGFEALYLSGGAISASMGLADLGIMTIEELCGFVKTIARATNLPIIVDGDTGYGEALNVMRLVRELETSGAAAVHIEDQVLPKKCGHLSDKCLIPAEAMAEKIAAAVKARTHLKIIARTDSFASEGLEGLINRSKRYLDAGADAIFPEALTSIEEFQTVANALDCPLLANMTEFGQTPYLTADEFEQLGYKMLIWPVSSLRIAAGAMETFYNQLFENGTAKPQLEKMLTRKRLYQVLDYEGYEALDSAILKSSYK